MTDTSNLRPGDALTYEQAMALPDGAVVSAKWNYDAQRTFFTVGSNDEFGVPKKFGGSTLEHEDYWNYDQWHSVRLESLPELPVWVITCDRCGTTYKNNERHACDDREPAKPERQTSEIEKRAAMALVELFKNTIEECVMTRRLESLRGRCTEYIEAYDYAKSIGAIE